MSSKVKLYAIFAFMLAAVFSTDYLVNMYTVTASVIVDEAMAKLEASQMDHARVFARRRDY
jgi:hypothetical protein